MLSLGVVQVNRREFYKDYLIKPSLISLESEVNTDTMIYINYSKKF